MIRHFLIIFFALTALVSCKKDLENANDDGELTFNKVMEMYASPDPNANYIVISSSQSANYFDTINSYYTLAYASF